MKKNKLKGFVCLLLVLTTLNYTNASECIQFYQDKVEVSEKLLDTDTKTAVGVLTGGTAVSGLIATIAGVTTGGMYLGAAALYNLASYAVKSGKAEKDLEKSSKLLEFIDENNVAHEDMRSLLEMAVGVNDSCRDDFEDTLYDLKENICTMFTKEKTEKQKRLHRSYSYSKRRARKTTVVDDTPEFNTVLAHIVKESRCY